MRNEMKTWLIEPIRESDIDTVLEIHRVSFSTPWSREMLAGELRNAEICHFYVARGAGEEVLAFCSCWLIQDELHINSLAVTPGYRGQGLGRNLMAFVLEASARRGARRATLEVRRSNEAAQRLYRGLGFVLAGRRPNYYSDPQEEALVYWRDDLASLAMQAASG
jgi:[ribosomal protein S18]-alanine N-acetyltransferase